MEILHFFTFTDPNIRYVVLGTMLLTGSAAVVGTFALLKKKALLGDATAHAVFPGICLVFMITGSKHPLYMMLGAFATGWLALLLIDLFIKHSKIQEDVATTLLLAITFGTGTFLLSLIQNSANTAQVGLSHYFFGKAAALVSTDVYALTVLNIIITLTIISFFKEFSLITFDSLFAKSLKLPVSWLEFIFTSLMVLTIVLGVRTVGIVLISAMLITPPAAASFWTDRLWMMVIIAAGIGMLSGLIGSFISYTLPGMPTGPWIVLIATSLAYISFLFAPDKGLIAKRIRHARHKRKILHENILKLFYEIGKKKGDLFACHSLAELLAYRPIPIPALRQGIRNLTQSSLLFPQDNMWRFTGAGKHASEQIIQKHQLWKSFLTDYVKEQPITTDENAELMEHVLTPDVMAELQGLLHHKSA